MQTLLGSDCSENETLQPAPWASELSPIMGLASESEATAGQMALVLTSHQVIQVRSLSKSLSEWRQVVQEETCAEASHDACVQALFPSKSLLGSRAGGLWLGFWAQPGAPLLRLP